jgi:glycosyltransferase involved in cell wall biosynthesis
MRLLYLTADPGVPVLGHKGASVHVRKMASALAAAGASVTVASPRIDPEGDVLDPAVYLRRIAQVLPDAFADAGALLPAVAAQADEVTELARERRVDAIYERFSLFSCAGASAARALGIPHVLEVNAPLREEARRFRSLPFRDVAREIEMSVFAAADRIFAVSGRLAELLRAEGVPAAKVEVAPNAVAADDFPAPADRERSAFTVGFAGGMKAWHGIQVLASAFGQALAMGLDGRLETIGTGPLVDELDAAGLPEEKLVCHGPLSHAEALRRMLGWRVGVAPYLPVPDFYFSPLKVLEYMATGLCPVASDLGDIRALLGGGSRGVLVAPGSSDDLAAALVELSRDRERAWRLGARARDYVLAHHRWEDNAERVLAAIGAPAAAEVV